MIYSEKLQKAIKFAIKTHEIYQKQKRKGYDIAYTSHPLTVGIILARAGAQEEIVIAGILHDTIEDSKKEKKVTPEMIESRFGKLVVDLVVSVTQESGLSWTEKKKNALENIKRFSNESMFLKSADVLSNAQDIIYDYDKKGDQIFEKFNAPDPKKENTIDNYLNIIEVILSRWDNNPLKEDLKLLSEELQRVKKFAKLKQPRQCHLWQKENLEVNDLKFGKVLKIRKIYTEDDNFRRLLVECADCEQLYFYEYYEDTSLGEGPEYRTFIPVESEEIARMIASEDKLKVGYCIPRIQSDFLKEQEKPNIRWIGKNIA